MTQRHTIEPWRVHQDASGDVFVSSELTSFHIAEIGSEDDETVIPDARRIVACVNACEGIPTDDLEDTKLLPMLDSYGVAIQQRDDLQAQVDELRAKADDLLEILSSIENDNGQISQAYWLKIQETVQKYTGETK